MKALVFRARRSLTQSREAREVSCAEIREQLTVLSGGSLRRKVLREHLLTCEGCSDFRQEVRRRRTEEQADPVPETAASAPARGKRFPAAAVSGRRNSLVSV